MAGVDEPGARVVFLGSGEFALRILDGLASDASVVLAAVVTTPPRPAGRRGELHPTPVAARASELGLPLLEPERLRDPAAAEAIRAHAPDVLVLADYGRIVPPVILELAPHGALNLHPSLLPRHRGATPIPAAILAGDAGDRGQPDAHGRGRRHRPARGAGASAAQRGRDGARAGGTAGRCRRRAAALVVARAGWQGRLPATPQSAVGVTVTRPLRREDGRLDPGRGSVELERQVRAYRPWPGTFLDGADGRLIVLAARPLPCGRHGATRPVRWSDWPTAASPWSSRTACWSCWRSNRPASEP